MACQHLSFNIRYGQLVRILGPHPSDPGSSPGGGIVASTPPTSYLFPSNSGQQAIMRQGGQGRHCFGPSPHSPWVRWDTDAYAPQSHPQATTSAQSHRSVKKKLGEKPSNIEIC